MSFEKEFPGPFREGIKAILRVLDPQDNSTGGGAASAVAGAMAAALLAMVGRLSWGKPGMGPKSFYDSLVKEAQDLAQVLMLGAQEDAQAFEFVMAAYRMPKADEKHRQKRQEAIQKALEKAAQVPLENARVCARVLELCRLMEDHYNPRASSDFNCARYLAKAALKGCLENVSINLSQLESPELVEKLTQASQELETWVVSF